MAGFNVPAELVVETPVNAKVWSDPADTEPAAEFTAEPVKASLMLATTVPAALVTAEPVNATV
jgi:hypothetical protein